VVVTQKVAAQTLPVVGAAVAAIENHAPPVRGGDYGTLAVADIEDVNPHGEFLRRGTAR